MTKSPVRIKITAPGSLQGYKLSQSASVRRKHLASAVKKKGYGHVMKKVNALYIFNRNKYPSKGKLLSSDKKWLSKKYKGKSGLKTSPSGRRKSRKGKRKSRKGKKSSPSGRRKSRKGKRKSRKGKRKSRKSHRKGVKAVHIKK